MGASLSYLDEPKTDKESTDDTSGKLDYGASSMQGWRNTQEDAHNCILDFDTETSFFAVYDGHGGHEVAEYCSQELPNFIKNTPEYKEGKIEEAFISGFLKFDSLITTPDVAAVLKKIAANSSMIRNSDDDDDDVDEEENVNTLYEEAVMPIEEVIKKYTSSLEKNEKTDDKRKSSSTKTKKEDDEAVGSSSAACSSSKVEEKPETSESTSNEASTTVVETSEAAKSEVNGPEKAPESDEPTSSDSKQPESTGSEEKKKSQAQNSEIPAPSSEAEANNDVSSTSAPVENGTPSKKGKGKAVIKPETVKTSVNTRPKRNAQQLFKEWLDMGEDSDDSDEEDQTFDGPDEESSDEDGEEGVNVSIDATEEDGSEEEGEGDEDDDEDDVEEEEEDDEETRNRCLAFARNMRGGPGWDSGCTAVVALLKGNELYVANVGDSRCVVCRNGQAVAMSYDHQPTSKVEYKRIVKAGGEISGDGRVNGGLNLSRAFGDFSYKQNKELSDREQMITVLPDIKKLTLSPGEDEFMVLACDGIWNSMSRQEVVDFVKERINDSGKKLSQICEEMFDHCLSPDTPLDSTGSDNMTAIIIRFKGNNKRAASPLPNEENEAKKAKTETDSGAQGDAAV